VSSRAGCTDTAITANCLHPGFVVTRFGDQSGDPIVPTYHRRVKTPATIPGPQYERRSCRDVLFGDCEAGLPLDLFSLALSQAHPRAPSIVIDEFDTCNFQGASDHFESCSTGLG
jgi:hypothetical protein